MAMFFARSVMKKYAGLTNFPADSKVSIPCANAYDREHAVEQTVSFLLTGGPPWYIFASQ